MIMVISAGGTGGHIMPALAIGLELRNNHSCDLHWLGADGMAGSMENGISAKHKIPFYGIKISALRGKGLVRVLLYPFILLRALVQACTVLQRIKPTAIFTTSGYTSVPTALAGFVLGIPVFLQEQNTHMGWASKLISLFAVRIYFGFMPAGKLSSKDREKMLVFGNPSLLDSLPDKLPKPAQRYKNRTGPLRIFVTGGSQGALVFNHIIPEALSKGLASSFEVWHQAGAGKNQTTAKLYKDYNIAKVKVDEFIDSIQDCYQWADIVIARAGALTITDLTLSGVVAILVPYPYATGDHQMKNATALGDAALVIEQQHFSAAKLRCLLAAWVKSGDAANPSSIRQELAIKAEKLHALALPNATAKIVNNMMEKVYAT